MSCLTLYLSFLPCRTGLIIMSMSVIVKMKWDKVYNIEHLERWLLHSKHCIITMIIATDQLPASLLASRLTESPVTGQFFYFLFSCSCNWLLLINYHKPHSVPAAKDMTVNRMHKFDFLELHSSRKRQTINNITSSSIAPAFVVLQRRCWGTTW
jgi:hypothetical protein